MSNDAIIILFRCINFFVLLGLCFYFLKKKGWQAIKDRMLKKKFENYQSHELYRGLVAKKEDLCKAIEQQQERIDTLIIKIDYWATQTEEHKQRSLHNQEKYTRALLSHALTVSKQGRTEKELSMLMPSIVHDATETINQYFSDKKNRELFMQEVINHMDLPSER